MNDEVKTTPSAHTDYQHNRAMYGPCPNIIQFNYLTKGLGDTATKLGVGYSTLSKYIAKNKAPVAVEKLAGYMLKEKTGGKQGSTTNSLLMVKVPESKLELIKTFLKGADVRYSHFKDM